MSERTGRDVDGFSIRYWDAPSVEVGSTTLGGVSAVTPDDAGDLVWRFESQTRRDDVLFERHWFADFRVRFREDMRQARIQFLGQLTQITEGACRGI